MDKQNEKTTSGFDKYAENNSESQKTNPEEKELEKLEAIEWELNLDTIYVEDFYAKAKDLLMPIKLLKHLANVKQKIYAKERLRIEKSVHDKAYKIADVESMALEVGLNFTLIRTLPLLSRIDVNHKFIGFVYQILYDDKQYAGFQAFPLDSNVKRSSQFEYAGAITYWRRQIILVLLGFGNDDFDPEFDETQIKKQTSESKIQIIKKEFQKISTKDKDYISKLPNNFNSQSKNIQDWIEAIKHYKDKTKGDK